MPDDKKKDLPSGWRQKEDLKDEAPPGYAGPSTPRFGFGKDSKRGPPSYAAPPWRLFHFSPQVRGWPAYWPMATVNGHRLVVADVTAVFKRAAALNPLFSPDEISGLQDHGGFEMARWTMGQEHMIRAELVDRRGWRFTLGLPPTVRPELGGPGV
jgi:hypothetical protein